MPDPQVTPSTPGLCIPSWPFEPSPWALLVWLSLEGGQHA